MHNLWYPLGGDTISLQCVGLRFGERITKYCIHTFLCEQQGLPSLPNDLYDWGEIAPRFARSSASLEIG